MTSPGPSTRAPLSVVRRLVKELGAFGVVGAVALVIDLGLFQLCYKHAGIGAVTSRGLSALVSMTVAYVGHRHWSFAHRARTGVRREYLLFALVNGVTLLISLAVVAIVRYPLGQDSTWVLQIANIGSVGLGTILRYLAYRIWVFPAHEPAVVPVAARVEETPNERATRPGGRWSPGHP